MKFRRVSGELCVSARSVGRLVWGRELKPYIAALAVVFTLVAGSTQAATFGSESLPQDSILSALTAKSSDLTDPSDAFADRMAFGGAHGYTSFSGEASGLPSPGAWAMMMMGFGAAGAAMRRRRQQLIYRLEENAPHGRTLTEEFAAPDDAAALCRATSVVSGDFKLWRGDVLVRG